MVCILFLYLFIEVLATLDYNDSDVRQASIHACRLLPVPQIIIVFEQILTVALPLMEGRTAEPNIIF